jgi:hypothetical protein
MSADPAWTCPHRHARTKTVSDPRIGCVSVRTCPDCDLIETSAVAWPRSLRRIGFLDAFDLPDEDQAA